MSERSSPHRLVPQHTTDLWLHDPDNGRVRLMSDARLTIDTYVLESVEARIWLLIDGKRNIQEIAETLALDFACVPPVEELVADCHFFLEELREQGLVCYLRNTEAVDVLLVMPPAPSQYAPSAIETPEFSAPPLGLLYIAAVLRGNGISVAVVDLHQTVRSPEAVVAEMRCYAPRIVGVTATTPSFPNAERVARFAKAYAPDIATVVGGPHATGMPAKSLSPGAFDYVCIGEGEFAMLELVQALLGNQDPAGIPGIGLLRDGKYVPARPRPLIADLDVLPFPARDLLPLDNYYQKGAIIGSRGCPIGCNFCACATIVGTTARYHSVDYVMAEIAHMRAAYGIRFFDFHDDTFNLSKRRVSSFCAELSARNLGIAWGCFCRSAQFSFEQAREMVASGCKVVQFGMESGDDRILITINKKTSVRQMEDSVKTAAEAGVERITCGFIIGHADDSVESIERTLALGERLVVLGATRLTVSLLTPYPGTPVYHQMTHNGIELLTDDWEAFTFSRIVMRNKNLSSDQLRELYFRCVERFLELSQN